MQRRDLITLLGDAAVAWPLVARVQQSAMPVIGWLDGGSPAGMTANLAAFYKGLGETGYIEGQKPFDRILLGADYK